MHCVSIQQKLKLKKRAKCIVTLWSIMAGAERILDKESGTFKYFLKVVPTEYVKLDGE